MEYYLYCLFGALVGAITVIGFFLTREGQIEGNREDYILKVGLMKKELAKANDKICYLESLLELSNEECHRTKKKCQGYAVENDRLKTRIERQSNFIGKLSRENEELHNNILDLKIVIRDTHNGLAMLTK